MRQNEKVDTPLPHIGIFDSIKRADRAVSNLLDAGFSSAQITVMCSNAAVETHFERYEHQDPSGTYTPAAAIAGGAIGAALGGLAAIAGVASGGVALLAAGGLTAWTGGVVGGLVGAMVTRGFEKELANYYDQAVVNGKILVAAEDNTPDRHEHLLVAEGILRAAGAEPLALPEG